MFMIKRHKLQERQTCKSARSVILRYYVKVVADVVKVSNGRWSQMADDHLGLGSNSNFILWILKFCA